MLLFFNILNWVVIVYFIFNILVCMLSILLSFFSLHKAHKESLCRQNYDIISSKYTLSISILVPCFNEENTIIENVKSLMQIEYQDFEIIVIDDGSKDKSLEKLIKYFEMMPIDFIFEEKIPTKKVNQLFISHKYPNLIVLDKENGGKADSLNAGINLSRKELITTIDADSILEKDSMSLVVEPFTYKENVVATSGIVRIANGSSLEGGFLKEIKISRNYFVSCQVLEYIRAFLVMRIGLNLINGLIIISGAFGVFRKDILIAVGGYNSSTIGEDMDLVVKIHKYCLKNNMDYSIELVPKAVCWTEAPAEIKTFFKQRKRWHKGLMDVMFGHINIIFNPKYKIIGMLIFPYYFIYEMLRPILEVLGYVVIAGQGLLGVYSNKLTISILIFAIFFGIATSITAILLDNIYMNKYKNFKDIMWIIFIAVIEIFPYHFIASIDYLLSMFSYRFRNNSWDDFNKKGIGHGNN